MNCPNCNTPNDELAKVCVSCGAPLDTEDDFAPEQDRNAMLEEIQMRRLKKKKLQKRKKIILLCILLALILAAVAYGINAVRNIYNGTGGDDNIIIASPTPSAIATLEATMEPEPTEEIAATPEVVEPAPATAAPVITSAPKPVITSAPKPVSTKKPAATKPVKTPAPVVVAPAFQTGSIAPTPVVQGQPMASQLVTVTSVETAPNGKSIAKFTIGSQAYFVYADASVFNQGVPAMYALDATATEDVYYGLPVYAASKIVSFAKDEYIIADSSTRLLTEADLQGLSKAQLDLARNEIFARHGRTFKKQELQSYFESKSWYKKNSAYNYSNDYLNLSDIEVTNAKFILNYTK